MTLQALKDIRITRNAFMQILSSRRPICTDLLLKLWLHTLADRLQQGWPLCKEQRPKCECMAGRSCGATRCGKPGSGSGLEVEFRVRNRLVVQCSLKAAHKGKLRPDLSSSVHNTFCEWRGWPWAWPAQQPRLACGTKCCPELYPAY